MTQHFPPLADVSTQRVLGFSRHLPALGFLPVFVVPRSYWEPFQNPKLWMKLPQRFCIYRVPFPEARKVFRTKRRYGTHPAPLTLAQRIHRSLLFPDSKVFFSLFALPFCLWAIKSQGIRLVLTHSPPHSTHLVGLLLKKLLPDIKWVADFEDAYSASPHCRAEGKLRLSFHRKLEQLIYSSADLVVVATSAMAKAATRIYPASFAIVENGYDPEDFKEIDPAPLPQLSLVHAGSFFAFRSPVPFLQLLEEYFAQYPESRWRCYFVGRIEMNISSFLKNSQLSGRVFFLGHRTKDETVAYLKGAKAFVVIHGNREEARLHLPAKVFEYAALRKPLIAYTHPGPLSHFVKKHRLGIVIEPGNPEGLRKLKRFLDQVEEGTYPEPEVDTKAFSRAERAATLAHFFRELIQKSCV